MYCVYVQRNITIETAIKGDGGTEIYRERERERGMEGERESRNRLLRRPPDSGRTIK